MTALSPLSSQKTGWTLTGVPKSAEALALAELLRGKAGTAPKRIVHIAVNDRHMETLAASLAFFAPDVPVLRFPAWDCMPYDRTSPQPAIMAERLRALSILAAANTPSPLIVLTTVNAATQKLPPRERMKNAMALVKTGAALSQDSLVHTLVALGYRRAGKAMEPGEFAVRGGILDIIVPHLAEGVRIDFFGDDVESLRRFDPLSQKSQGTLDELSLHPVSEVLLDDISRQHFREQYREHFGAVTRDDPLYESISAGHSYPGMEHWLPFFHDKLDSLFDYCDGALITIDAEAQATLTQRQESILDYYNARKEALKTTTKKNSFASGAIYNPVPPEEMFLTETAWQMKWEARPTARFTPFTDSGDTEGTIALGIRPSIRFSIQPQDGTPFDQLKNRLGQAEGKSLLLACFSNGSRERLQTLLSERGFHCLRVDSWKDIRDVRGKTVGLAILPIESGFETPDVIVLSEQDVLGERIARAAAKKKKSQLFLMEAANFNEGELVTHKEHGIGRFDGLVTLTVSGAAHDCLKLIYAGDDKLFLPVENIDVITRFGADEEGVQLDKLGGASWQARKARLKEKILLAAEALLKTAAERQIKAGSVLEPAPGSYDDFVARFPYAETEDQARAIEDVLEDLHKGRPMDRLICGDVGFGKTEVALRAAFAAACGQHKMQVALIAPTTLLARQHYRNFRQRFEGFPVTVRQLSRIVSAKEQKETREMLADGKVDIIIGTHALLSKQVSFKNLGLLIVDEEQHFGVAQKEKLKSLKSDVHVLTLSATPIPRTLQMALTGVRDLSLITTPPIDRLAVRSFVMPFDPVVLHEAITRELHRGGQCFAVTPRIKDIAQLKTQLHEIAPEARLAVAHGQLSPATLDTIMNDFYDGKYDILISTAIIESGLDIPTTNTLIIHNAHLFGLSQLYQLRGRVGRGKLRAYAYFLLPHHKELTRNATKRLEVMQTLDTLGAGFTLASHDMDIRGFGNLVGEEQSGHIREVGIELYQQMLEEAVEQLRRGTKDTVIEQEWSPQINLGLAVLIPETYVDDLQLRLGLYRRAASLAQAADIDSFAAELTDRFGEQPVEVQHLIAVLGLKLLCKEAGIDRLDVGPKGAVLSFRNNIFARPDALLGYVQKHARTLKVRPDQKLVFTHEWKDAEDKIGTLTQLASAIAALTH